MSERADITEANKWFRGEHKVIRITMEDATNLTTFALQWVVQHPGSSVDLLTKSSADGGITVEDDGANVGAVAVIEVETEDTMLLDARTYHHALWRVDPGVEQILSEGSALLQNAARLGVEGS